MDEVLIENYVVPGNATVIYAKTPAGESLYGSLGYTPRSTAEAYDILLRQLGCPPEALTPGSVQVMTAAQALDLGIRACVTLCKDDYYRYANGH